MEEKLSTNSQLELEKDNQQKSDLTDGEERQSSRFYFFWVCLIIFGLLIFIGWLYFVNKNFTDIDQQLQQSSDLSTQEASDQFEQVMKEFGKIFNPEEESEQVTLDKLEQEEQKAQDLQQAAQEVKEKIENSDQ